MGGVAANVDASPCGAGPAVGGSPATVRTPAHRMNMRLHRNSRRFAARSNRDWSIHDIVYVLYFTGELYDVSGRRLKHGVKGGRGRVAFLGTLRCPESRG